MTSTVTAAAVSKNFGANQDAAAREPVIITKNGRPRTVLLAYEDYLRLSCRDRRVEVTADLSDDDLAAVEKNRNGARPRSSQCRTADGQECCRLKSRSAPSSAIPISVTGNISKAAKRATRTGPAWCWRYSPRSRTARPCACGRSPIRGRPAPEPSIGPASVLIAERPQDRHFLCPRCSRQLSIEGRQRK